MSKRPSRVPPSVRRGMLTLAAFEDVADRAIVTLRRRAGLETPLQIVAYRGFGNADAFWVRGRVVERPLRLAPEGEQSAWRNFRQMWWRFTAREVPETDVEVRVGNSQCIARTDREGYFKAKLTREAPLERASHAAEETEAWRVAEVALAGGRRDESLPARVELRVPQSSAEYGIVSDIDDTILQTHVTRRAKMLWVTLVGNALTRSPFTDASQFYASLVNGASGRAENPVFYVSKSPWNLYDFLVDFLEENGFPRGPLFLRELGFGTRPAPDFKGRVIARLLKLYPKLPFVLIGDSGERDPETYLKIAEEFPQRVLAIYIRKLGRSRYAYDLQALARRARDIGCAFGVIGDSEDALQHARGAGLLR